MAVILGHSLPQLNVLGWTEHEGFHITLYPVSIHCRKRLLPEWTWEKEGTRKRRKRMIRQPRMPRKCWRLSKLTEKRTVVRKEDKG